MARLKNSLPRAWSVADLLEHFGEIPPRRIRLQPAPGSATEDDVLRLRDREDRLYELVDGVLVEKTVGIRESCLAALLIRLLGTFVEAEDRGLVTAPDGVLRLAPGLVRIPDVAFISWARLPRREFPDDPLPDLVPDLAVEVLSENNTRAEMQRKLKDYFLAGVQLVWYVDPVGRAVSVYTAPDEFTRLGEGETLDGGAVLPGFAVPVRQLFARVSRQRRTRRPDGRKRTK
jgi:Uma2 family endonuclease